jgi:membrane protein implicated in regulation of membrane protease activity
VRGRFDSGGLVALGYDSEQSMDSPEQWSWLWLIATAVFAVGEMTTPGSFFLAPFAVGAFAASILALAGVGVLVEWIVFFGVSIATLALLRPLSRRLDRNALDHGVGSRRLLGRQAIVLRDIPAGGDLGMVRVDREEWRAQSIDSEPISAGTIVRVADVQGTRVIVTALDAVPSPKPSPLPSPETTIPSDDAPLPPTDDIEPPASTGTGDSPT